LTAFSFAKPTKSSETNCKQIKKRKTAKGTNIVRLPVSELKYLETLKHPVGFGQWLDGLDEKYKLLLDADLTADEKITF